MSHKETAPDGPISLEARVTRLEEENYFLGRRVEELNQALTLQQKQCDALEHELARAMDALTRLRDAVTSGPVNVPPPHHNTW